MKTVGLDGYSYNFKPKDKERANASNLHKSAIEVVDDMWPHTRVLQEVRVEIWHKKYVYFDLYLPTFLTFIEIHGQQHYKYTPQFHKRPIDFLRQKRRDRDKEEWCKLNNFIYVEFPYNKVSEWTEILLKQSTNE